MPGTVKRDHVRISDCRCGTYCHQIAVAGAEPHATERAGTARGIHHQAMVRRVRWVMEPQRPPGAKFSENLTAG